MVDKYDKRNEPANLAGFLGFFILITGNIFIWQTTEELTYILIYSNIISVLIIVLIALSFVFYDKAWVVYKYLEE